MIYTREKNGKKQYQYRCYYTNFDGSRKQKNSKWYDTKKEAIKQESLFIQSQSVGQSNVTFEEVMNQWVIHKERTVKPFTMRTKLHIIKHFKPFYNRKIEKITYIDIDNFFDNLKLRETTKRQVKIELKSIFTFAKTQFNVQNDPFLKAKPLKKPTDMKEIHVITKEDFKKIYNELSNSENKNDKEISSILWLLYYTGMRINECLSLTFNDFDGHSVNVNKQYRNGGWSTPKTKSSIRKIALEKHSIELIQEQLIKYKDIPNFTKQWFIFGGYHQMCEETVANRKNITCDKLGIQRFKLHALRHSHASNLIESGVNMYKISKRLGHSSISTTMDIYGHLIDEDEKEILKAISDF